MFVEAGVMSDFPLRRSGTFIMHENDLYPLKTAHFNLCYSVRMANTYSQIYIQGVFAVEQRMSLIRKEWKEELFKYIGGIFRNKKQKLIAIGGVEDHIHLLFGLKPSTAISDLIRDVKSDSTEFINKRKFVRGSFYWQEGFGAFSYSRSQLDAVAKYVLNQEKHHAKRTFREEYTTLLDRFEVEYEDRYLFNWIE